MTLTQESAFPLTKARLRVALTLQIVGKRRE